MKAGRSLQSLAAELERQVATRKDYLAPQGALTAVVEPDSHEVTLDGLNGGSHLRLNPFAHEQMGDHLNIPRKYYARMQAESPELLAANINGWFQKDPTNKRMVRTLDGHVRAVLSPKFRPLENFDLAETVLPILTKHNVQVLSAELTERRLYIKGILPALSDVLPDGLVWGQGHNAVSVARERRIVAALVISNSEIGAGAIRIEPSVFSTWCTNLAIMTEAAMKKYHVGRAFDADANFEVFRDETREQDDKAFWMKVRDVTEAAFDPTVWATAVAQVRAAAQQPIVSNDLSAVVDLTVKTLALPERSSAGILAALARGGDLSQFGLSSAITVVANEWDDYEGATDLERAGGKVLALDAPAWGRLSAAA